jgi:quercetin dioxygenase-like cupin family protein
VNQHKVLKTAALWICLNYSFSTFADLKDIKLPILPEVGKYPSTFIQNNDAWKRENWGEFKDLVRLKDTNTFGEQTFKLKSGASISSSPLVLHLKSYRALHVIDGVLRISVSTTKENSVRTQLETLKRGDVLILTPGAALVRLENISKSQCQFDYTFSSPIVLDSNAAPSYRIQRQSDQQEIRFKVNLDGPEQIARTLVNGDEVSDTFSKMEFVIGKKEEGPSFHTHATFETFRIPPDMSGSLEVSIGGDGKREIKLMPGDIANVSPGVPHSYRNLTAENEVKLVATFAPAGLEKMFIGFHKVYSQYLMDRKNTKSEDEIIELTKSYPSKLNAVRQMKFNQIEGLRSPAKGAWKTTTP